MGTHPIFESDFDCLTETSKSCQTEKTPRETSTIHTRMAATTTTTVMAATMPPRATITTTPPRREMKVGTTTPERTRTALAPRTELRTSDDVRRPEPSSKILL